MVDQLTQVAGATVECPGEKPYRTFEERGREKIRWTSASDLDPVDGVVTHGEGCCKGSGRIYALPDETKVRVRRPCDHRQVEFKGLLQPYFCQGHGWNASDRLEVWAKAGWPIMEKLSETETKGAKWHENWMLFDTYKTACARGDLEGAIQALARALEAQGTKLMEN